MIRSILCPPSRPSINHAGTQHTSNLCPGKYMCDGDVHGRSRRDGDGIEEANRSRRQTCQHVCEQADQVAVANHVMADVWCVVGHLHRVVTWWALKGCSVLIEERAILPDLRSFFRQLHITPTARLHLSGYTEHHAPSRRATAATFR